MLPSAGQKRIILSALHYEQMLQDVDAKKPEEACGLLAGRIIADTYESKQVFPAQNLLHSPFRYRMEPLDQIELFQQIEALKLDLIGIYHSHPAGPAVPSNTDLSEAYYPEVFYLIWSPVVKNWQCQAFQILEKTAIPVEIIVTKTV